MIYSKHITKKDRLIYDIYDDVIKVLVLTAKGHYQTFSFIFN